MACQLLILFSSLSFFVSVLASAPPSVTYARRVESPAHNLISDSGEVPDSAASNEYYRVLLEVMPLAGDVRRHLHLVGEPYPGYLSEGGVRLPRRLGPDLNTHAALLRRARATVPAVRQGVKSIPESRRLLLLSLRFPALSDKLIYGRHDLPELAFRKNTLKDGRTRPEAPTGDYTREQQGCQHFSVWSLRRLRVVVIPPSGSCQNQHPVSSFPPLLLNP